MSELPSLLTPSQEETAAPEFDSYSIWESKNSQQDHIGDRKRYSDYVRQSYLQAGSYDGSVEKSIRDGLKESLIQVGAVDREDEDTFNQLLKTEKPPLEDQLRFIQSTAKSDSEQWMSATQYLAFQNALNDGDLENNPDLAQKEKEHRSRAEQTANTYYNTALRNAVSSGEIAMAKVTDSEGMEEVIAGPLMRHMSFNEALKQSVSVGGMSYSDAAEAQRISETPIGYQEPRYRVKEYENVSLLIDSLAKENENVSNVFSSYQESLAELQDEDVSPERREVLEERMESATTTVEHYLNVSGLREGEGDVDLDNVRKAMEHNAAHVLNASGGFEYFEDAKDAGKNLRRLGYAMPLIHPATMANPEAYEATISANPDLTPEEVKLLATHRELFLESEFESYSKTLIDSDVSEEWLDALHEGRANKVKDTDTLQEFLKNPDNYSAVSSRLRGVGGSIVDGVGDMFAAIPAMMGADWAKDYLVNNMREKSNRREVARLFGDDFGLGQDVAEQIAPMLADMAATTTLAYATGGVGGVAYLAAKQGARLTAKGIAKGLVTNTLRASGSEATRLAAKRLVSQGLVKGAAKEMSEETAMGVIKGYNKAVASKMNLVPAMFIPAANRSAGATYASVYDQLSRTGDLSDEEIRDRALGAAMTAGAITGTITASFSALGRAGLEGALIGGLNKKQVKAVLDGIANRGGQVGEMSESAFNTIVKKTIATTLAKHGGYMGLAKTVGTNVVDEAVEEGFDEFANTFVMDSALDESTPFLERLQQAGHAAVIGGIMGGGVPTIRHVAGSLNAKSNILAKQTQVDQEFRAAVATNVEQAGLPITAKQVDFLLNLPARRREEITNRVLSAKETLQKQEADLSEKAQEDAPSVEEVTGFSRKMGDGVLIRRGTKIKDLSIEHRTEYEAARKVMEQDLSIDGLTKDGKTRYSVTPHKGNRIPAGRPIHKLSPTEYEFYQVVMRSKAAREGIELGEFPSQSDFTPEEKVTRNTDRGATSSPSGKNPKKTKSTKRKKPAVSEEETEDETEGDTGESDPDTDVESIQSGDIFALTEDGVETQIEVLEVLSPSEAATRYSGLGIDEGEYLFGSLMESNDVVVSARSVVVGQETEGEILWFIGDPTGSILDMEQLSQSAPDVSQANTVVVAPAESDIVFGDPINETTPVSSLRAIEEAAEAELRSNPYDGPAAQQLELAQSLLKERGEPTVTQRRAELLKKQLLDEEVTRTQSALDNSDVTEEEIEEMIRTKREENVRVIGRIQPQEETPETLIGYLPEVEGSPLATFALDDDALKQLFPLETKPSPKLPPVKAKKVPATPISKVEGITAPTAAEMIQRHQIDQFRALVALGYPVTFEAKAMRGMYAQSEGSGPEAYGKILGLEEGVGYRSYIRQNLAAKIIEVYPHLDIGDVESLIVEDLKSAEKRASRAAGREPFITIKKLTTSQRQAVNNNLLKPEGKKYTEKQALKLAEEFRKVADKRGGQLAKTLITKADEIEARVADTPRPEPKVKLDKSYRPFTSNRKVSQAVVDSDGNVTTAHKVIRGAIDRDGRGVFNNDPVLVGEMLLSGIPIKIPADILRGVGDIRKEQINPAIRYDRDGFVQAVRVMNADGTHTEAYQAPRRKQRTAPATTYSDLTANIVGIFNKDLPLPLPKVKRFNTSGDLDAGNITIKGGKPETTSLNDFLSDFGNFIKAGMEGMRPDTQLSVGMDQVSEENLREERSREEAKIVAEISGLKQDLEDTERINPRSEEITSLREDILRLENLLGKIEERNSRRSRPEPQETTNKAARKLSMMLNDPKGKLLHLPPEYFSTAVAAFHAEYALTAQLHGIRTQITKRKGMVSQDEDGVFSIAPDKMEHAARLFLTYTEQPDGSRPDMGRVAHLLGKRMNLQGSDYDVDNRSNKGMSNSEKQEMHYGTIVTYIESHILNHESLLLGNMPSMATIAKRIKDRYQAQRLLEIKGAPSEVSMDAFETEEELQAFLQAYQDTEVGDKMQTTGRSRRDPFKGVPVETTPLTVEEDENAIAEALDRATLESYHPEDVKDLKEVADIAIELRDSLYKNARERVISHIETDPTARKAFIDMLRRTVDRNNGVIQKSYDNMNVATAWDSLAGTIDGATYEHEPEILGFLRNLRLGKLESGVDLREALKFIVFPTEVSDEFAKSMIKPLNDLELRDSSYTVQEAKTILNGLAAVIRQRKSTSIADTDASREAARKENGEVVSQLALESGDPSSVVSALEQIRKSDEDENHQLVADLLLEDSEFISTVNFHIVDSTTAVAGLYEKTADGEHNVTLNLAGSNGRGLVNVLLEEYIHAFTSDILARPEGSLTKAQAMARNRLKGLMKIAKSEFASRDTQFETVKLGFENVDEFVANFLLNPTFQSFLKSVETPAKQRGLMSRIIEAIVTMFRKITNGKITPKEVSQYTAALNDIVDLTRSDMKGSRGTVEQSLSESIDDANSNAKDIEFHKGEGAQTDIKSPIEVIGSTQLELGLDVLEESMSVSSEMGADMERNIQSVVEQLVNSPHLLPSGMRNLDATELQDQLEGVIVFLRSYTPPEVSFQVDWGLDSSMAFKGGVIYLNPTRMTGVVSGMSQTNSNITMLSILDEELAHYASYNVLTEQEIMQVGQALGVEGLSKVAEDYYQTDELRNSAKERLRSEDPDVVEEETYSMVEEYLRMRANKAMKGFTTEQDAQFLKSNPSLTSVVFRYVRGVMISLIERYKLSGRTTNIDSKVNRLIMELRQVKSGYRQGPNGVAFDPNNPEANLVLLEAIMGEKISIDVAKEMGYDVGPKYSASSVGGSADIAGESSLDFSYIPQIFEVPLMHAGPYAAPKKFASLFQGDADPRLTRLYDLFQDTQRWGEKILKDFSVSFNKEVKKAYGSLEAAPTELFNEAIGSSVGAVLDQDVYDNLEKDRQDAIQLLNAEKDLTTEERESSLALIDARHNSKRSDAESAAADAIRVKQELAMDQIRQASPKLAELIRTLRVDIIDTLSKRVRDTHQVSDQLGARIDNQLGIYITRTYKMFTESGHYQRTLDGIKQGKGDYVEMRDQAIDLFERQFVEARVESLLKDEEMSSSEALAQARHELRSNPKLGYNALMDFIYSYSQDSEVALGNRSTGYKLAMNNLRRKRHDLPEELQNILGKNDDQGLDNLLRTFATVNTMTATQTFLERVKVIGTATHQKGATLEDKFLLTAQELEEAKAISDENYQKYSEWEPVRQSDLGVEDPLHGLWAPKDMVDSFRQMTSKQNLSQFSDTTAGHVAHSIVKFAHRSTGAAMATKTLGSAGFYVRNILSNILFFGPSQGFWRMDKMFKSAVKHITQVAVNPNKVDGYLSELYGLGVVGAEIQSKVMMELFNGTSDVHSLQRQVDDLTAKAEAIERGTDKAKKVAGQTAEAVYKKAAEMASAVDAFYKIAYFEHEVSHLQRAREEAVEGDRYFELSDRVLKMEAARKVRMTSQSADQVMPIVQQMTKSGATLMFAPFLRFRTEVIRIPINTVKLALEEIRSGNSVMRSRGRQRMTGLLTVMAGWSTVLPAVVAMIADIGDDEEEALRASIPDYLRGHTFFYLRDKEGELTSYDFTYINPFAMIIDPFLRGFNSMVRGDFSDATVGVAEGLVADILFDDQILAGSLLSISNNEDPTTGDPIYEETTDSVGDIAGKVMGHVFKEAYKPDFWKRGEAIYDAQSIEAEKFEDTSAGIVLTAFRPLKPHTIDAGKQFRNFLFQKKGEFSRANKRQFKIFDKKPMSEESIRELYLKGIKDNKIISEDMLRKMGGFEKLGVSKKEMYHTMVKAGFGKRRAQNIMNGVMDVPMISPQKARRLQEEGIIERGRVIFEERAKLPRQIELNP